MDQLPRLGKRELICLLWFTCNYVISFFFLWVLGMGYVIVVWYSLGLRFNCFALKDRLCIFVRTVYVWKNNDKETIFFAF